MKKRLYFVKREVWAKDIKEALTAKGKVYEAALADDRYQPENKKVIPGFTNN